MKNYKGLSDIQIQKQREKYGLNVLKIKNKNPWYKIFFSQFANLLIIILILASIICFLLQEFVDGIVILVVVIGNTVIGFVQEYKTEKLVEALQNMVYPQVRVIRNGKEQIIKVKNLVPNDIIKLEDGNKIPADCVILESNNLQVEESALTGESLPVKKKEKDKIYMGTSIVKGICLAKVIHIGMDTKFGNIANLATNTKKVFSPLQKELHKLALFITKIIIIICIILFILSVWQGISLFEALELSIAVAISAIPEGLPATITIALALGASALVKKKAIIKKLSSTDTLGAVTVICSDKTGTLTKNEMTVKEIFLSNNSIYHITGSGYNPEFGSINIVGKNKEKEIYNYIKEKILQSALLCNTASLIKENNDYKILGDPTEGALLTLYYKSGIDKKWNVRNIENIFPFDSDRKMMSVIYKNEVLAKGSPDHILDKCTYYLDGNKKQKLTQQKIEEIKTYYNKMGENALRVLAFAYKEINEKITDHLKAEKDLIFVGLVGMMDPPRVEVKEAIIQTKKAGIKVFIITGDYGITAKAIANELGLIYDNNELIIEGKDLDSMSDKDLLKILQTEHKAVIFARSMPEHKLKIVKLLQKNGEIVAMTGDGVNDAPALKKADIGIAMGITGTEISKEAADIILTDDSFASIVNAIEQGRIIYSNIKKFIWFIFTCNMGELLTVSLAILFRFPLPLTAILILIVNLGTDMLPSISLGVDDVHNDVMKDPPRNPNKRLINKKFLLNIFCIGLLISLSVLLGFFITIMKSGWVYGMQDFDFNHGRTVAFAILVFIQLVNVFQARVGLNRLVLKQNFFSNYFLLISIFSSVLMVMILIYIPFFNRVLSITTLNIYDWILILSLSFVPMILIEMYKIFFRKIN